MTHSPRLVYTGGVVSRAEDTHTNTFRSPGVAWAAGVLCGPAVLVAGVDGAAAATRAVMYGGVLAACGITLFQLVAHDQEGSSVEHHWLRSLVLVGAAAGAAATLVGLLLQVAMASGRGWLGLFDRRAAEVVFGSSSHLGAGQRVVGLVVVAYAAMRRGERAALAPVLGATGVAISLSSFLVAGHAATREPRIVGYAVDLTHTTTAAIWAGGLIGLAVVLHHRRPVDPAGAARVVQRFSLAASASVSLLLAGGFGLAWAELRPSGGVPFNGYGLVLMAKAAVALVALAIGAVNHFVVVPSVVAGAETVAGGDAAWAALSKTLRVELAAVVVLVALTGVLTGLNP
ncbi:MAG: copper transport protein [Acidimicrobiaceae bacterium]